MAIHHDPDQLRSAALIGARLAGCTCHPDVDVTEHGDGLYAADVRHDDWCPVIQRRSAGWN